MRTLLLLAATTALLLLTAAAPVQAEVGINNPNASTKTTLYFHVIDVQDMPINTQEPNPDFTTIGAYGPQTYTLRCLDPITGDVGGTGYGTQGTTSQVFHTNYGYSSPSYVEYNFQNANGQPRTHPERGISYDAIFDQGAPFTVTWYVSIYNADGQPGPTNPQQVPTPTPNMVVGVTMKTGDAISVDDKSYDQGITIASGATEAATLLPDSKFQNLPLPGPTTAAGQPSKDVTYEGQDATGRHIYKFVVKMAPQQPSIQRVTGFNVRIDMYMDVPQCNDQAAIEENKQYLMAGTVAPFSDADHRPTMDFSIMNPIRLEYLHPQFVGDDLVVHTSMNSAWGNYDVDEVSPPEAGGISVGITGPSAATSLQKAALVQRFHEHYHHQEAVDVTYVWPYKADRATNGLYTVDVAFENDQHTARATGTAQFEIGKGTVTGCGGIQESSQRQQDDCATTVQADGKEKAKQSPGLPLVGALGVLGALAVALRRRSD